MCYLFIIQLHVLDNYFFVFLLRKNKIVQTGIWRHVSTLRQILPHDRHNDLQIGRHQIDLDLMELTFKFIVNVKVMRRQGAFEVEFEVNWFDDGVLRRGDSVHTQFAPLEQIKTYHKFKTR